jgi:peptidyl serine alpha-galactosyltransferase
MLPRRQPTTARARSPHAAASYPISVRQAILGALAVVFLLGLYMNFQFLAQSTAGDSNALGASGHAATSTSSDKKLKNQLAFETREVKHVAFTSGCSELDFVHAEVLAHSLRATGYVHNVTHLVYGCAHAEFEQLQRNKNKLNGVEHVGFPVIKREGNGTFGHGLVTSTLQFKVIQQWFTQELNRNRLKDDDFVMLVESDAFFTKKPDIWNLFREVEDIEDPRWFGQDAAWYEPKTPPLATEALRAALPTDSPAIKLKDWRDFAATGPYVVEVSLLREVLPTVVPMWEKLPPMQRHLALPFAAAHHRAPIGISGALSVHHYPSRYENWDFVDDIKYNPCNETAAKRDIDMLSFPIMVRPEKFTLPQWIDGREWSFFASQLPKDFLHCDAWMLREPTGYIWYLASTTRGYERTPTILRRRHTMSVCMALQAYNAAAAAFKTTVCAKGFNANKKIPMNNDGATWSSALAYGAGGEGDVVALVGDVKRADSTKPAIAGQAKSDDLHFVFVTGCTPDDHWQSDLLTQSFADVRQRGRLTRVIAGCTDAELRALLERTRTAYPFIQLFATKSYAVRPTAEAKAGDTYTPYNKPFGLRDWLANSNPPVLESIVVVINGDFVFTRPLSFNSAHRVTTAAGVDSENYDQHSEVIEGLRVYKPFFVYEGQRSPSQIDDTVNTGLGLTQRWVVPAGFAATAKKICSDCDLVTENELGEYYAPNPPFILTKKDLSAVVDDYCAMTVKARTLDTSSTTAEALGLAAASAKHKIKFTSFSNLAVSRATAQDDHEYWGFLDFVKLNPCDETVDRPSVVAEGPRVFSGAASYRVVDAQSGTWVYDKTLVPANIFACDSWLLTVPPASVWLDAKKSDDLQRKKQAYGLCTSIKLLNAAIVKQRERLCNGGFNHNKRLRLVDPRPNEVLKVGVLDRAWETASNSVTR